MNRINLYDPTGKVIGYWVCIEAPVYGIHAGKWKFTEIAYVKI